jgi:hypothetical protein
MLVGLRAGWPIGESDFECRFEAFMADRQKRLLSLIEEATGKNAYSGGDAEEGEDIEFDDEATSDPVSSLAAG